MAIEIFGNWKTGLAYDIHTLASVYLGADEHGHDRWDTTRSEMGELVYRLKYNGDQSCIPKTIALLEVIKGIDTFDFIVPIPPTNPSRKDQPVTQIAEALGKHHGVRVLTDLLVKTKGWPELKNVDDPNSRRELLAASMALTGRHDISGKKLLLVDDLYRSGATLSVATELLLNQARASDVCVLTMTKTRSRR